jgi:hypothetical protein
MGLRTASNWIFCTAPMGFLGVIARAPESALGCAGNGGDEDELMVVAKSWPHSGQRIDLRGSNVRYSADSSFGRGSIFTHLNRPLGLA